MYVYARNNPLAFVDPTGYDYCNWSDGTSDNPVELGGATEGECEEYGGTWFVPTFDDTVDQSNSGTSVFYLDNWLDQWSAENGPLDSGFTFYATGTGGASSPGNSSAPSIPGTSQACPAGGSIYSGSLSFPLTGAGAAVGSLFGPMGMLPGALIGSMFGVGGTASYVPSTKSIYAGPTLTFGLGILGGGSFSVSRVDVPGTQNANAIANSWSFSATYQPTFATGATATKSPGSGSPVGGFSVGTRVPFAASASYNICLRNCGCQ